MGQGVHVQPDPNTGKALLGGAQFTAAGRLVTSPGSPLLATTGQGSPPVGVHAADDTPRLSGQLAYAHTGGTVFDAWHNNLQAILLASAARTATTSTANQTNYNARGVHVYLKVTAASGTGGLSVRIVERNADGSAAAYLNAAPTAVTAVGDYVYELYPGASGAGTNVPQRTSGALARTWYVEVTHGDASSYTYRVDAMTIV